MYLLATGERGIGWSAVFGDRRLTHAEFELYSYIQQRVLMARDEDGRSTIASEVAARERLAIEQRVRGIIAAEQIAPIAPIARTSDAADTDANTLDVDARVAIAVQRELYRDVPLDPLDMSDDERDAWLAARGL